uniref:DUF3825 domain-containing protein n=1 Tax=Candidatus Kentrum sp. TUN TaxID=2126343 RepID=A0A450ZIM3_9GAMM|nr:MAG: protein of unknown function (DUF3825) [Candidatus Kentron sp. TUN]
MQYKSLYRRYKNQLPEEIFSSFSWKTGEYWEEPFARLARLAKEEDWNFQNSQYEKQNQNFPILMNYINYTFLRLQSQDKFSFSGEGDKVCFNTGLQTRDEKDIFAIFFKNKQAKEREKPDWSLFSFADSYSEKLKPFNSSPDIATYIDDASNLVFDLDYEIEVNVAHIVDQNNERLPEFLQQNRTLAITSIEGATKFLKEKIRRNYKVAIPHWYDESIQLLLPLNITSDSEADLALVADKDKERRIYRIKTALTMDMAYFNARLICRPDRDWLNP